MQSSLEKLRKFFRLEAENKYANTAVIGGLAKILDFWEAEARNEGLSEELVQLVATRLRDYQRLTPSSRADTLKGVWKRIQGQIPDTDLPTPIYSAEPAAQPQVSSPKPPVPVEEAPASRHLALSPLQPEINLLVHSRAERKPTPVRVSSFPVA